MEVGDTVLHPRYGVGTIDCIEKRSQGGECRAYFVIPKPSISSTIFIPVDSADELGLRPLSSVEKCNTAIDILEGKVKIDGGTPNLRTSNLADLEILAQVVHDQVIEPKSRYPKISEMQQLRHVKKLLAEEISAVLGVSQESILAMTEKQEIGK